MRLRVAVMVSGRGSNLEALLRSLGPAADAEVVLVGSDRAGAGGLEVARGAGVPARVFNDSSDPAEWLRMLKDARADLVVLAGFVKQVPAEVVRAFAGRMINIHPALLPKHGGKGMYGTRVHEAVLAAGDRRSGATVHLVTEEYDRGPVLGRLEVPVLPDDTPASLAARVLTAEHRLLPAAVQAAAAAGAPVPFECDAQPVPLTPQA